MQLCQHADTLFDMPEQTHCKLAVVVAKHLQRNVLTMCDIDHHIQTTAAGRLAKRRHGPHSGIC